MTINEDLAKKFFHGAILSKKEARAVFLALLSAGSVDLAKRVAQCAGAEYSKEERVRAKAYLASVPDLNDGDLECDDGAVVSFGDDPGAYVQTWKWVSNEVAGLPDDDSGVEKLIPAYGPRPVASG